MLKQRIIMQLNPLDFSVSTINTGSSWVPRNNGVRVTYTPTGEFVECIEHRGVFANKAEAYQKLLELLQPELDKQLELDF